MSAGKFRSGQTTYRCADCGKLTRNTGQGEYEVGLCANCYERAELENQHNDDGHDTPVDNCPLCEVNHA